jgi:hypothetical protein
MPASQDDAVNLRFEPGLVPVLKHGSHDQSSHGRRGGMSASDSAASREQENVDYIMGRTIFPPAWSGPSLTTFVPKRSLADRVASARRKVKQWKTERARRELQRMTPAELERLGAANRARSNRERAERGLAPLYKATDPVLEILQRLFGDVVETGLWVAMIEDPKPIGEMDGPLGDLLDDMLNAVLEPGVVVKFAPGLRPTLKHLSGQHDQSSHGRGGRQGELISREGAGGGAADYSAWGDRAREIEYAARTGMSEDELRSYATGGKDIEIDPDDVRERVIAEYDYEIQNEVERRMSRTIGMEDDEEVEYTRKQYEEEAIEDWVGRRKDSVEQMMREEMAEELFDQSNAVEKFDEVYGAYHEGTTRDGTEVTLRSAVGNVYGPSGGDNAIVVQGEIFEDYSGAYAGRFERRFDADDNGNLTVTHELLELEENYQGTGFAKTFNRQAENYYISHGIETVNVHAALDGGGYAWATAGFDWDYRNHSKSVGNVDRRLGLYEQTVAGIPADLGRDIGRMRTRLTTLSVTDPDYPTPSEIANLGRVDGVDTWPGKVIMRGSNWYGTKTLRPEGARTSLSERAETARRASQRAYQAERAPGRGQKTMDRDFLEGALSQATTATTPLFPPIPGVVE